ncbi:sugar ABC transporter permease [Arthrobacter sp. AK01]|uniref:carbohydrate ABC transporter permease n=1 Tax=Micrococcaceae TaxID=1268 RepID=UPI001E3F156E|nr:MULTISPECIES: sugar ABC transporter permease [Micrococcaceae]MCD4852614.1 sugar ABC transporter permease [Arthrobacter sp. AK01]MCP1412788.1 multiple sugar transport system permease protein [Paenarthrobacter sp. A20]
MTTTSPVADAPPLVQSRKRAGRWMGWAFVGPFMAVFLLVFVAPVLYAFYLSLFQNQMVGGDKFVGGANYLQALGDPQFWDSVIRVAVFLVVQVPIMLFLALFAALALDSGRLRASSFFRISVFLPYAVPAVVATLMWGFIYGPRFGLFGSINDFFGLDLAEPLSSSWILASIGNINTWEFTGYNMLIFYSALKVIPAELYEAANLDGAGTFRVIRSIKLPSIRGAIGIASIFSVIGSFQLFNEPNILKALAPNSISSYFTPNMYAYNLSFAGQQFNYAAAISIIMGVLTVIVAYVVQLSGSRKDA